MKKLNWILTLTAVVIGATLLLLTTLKVTAAPSPTGIRNVVLVHGAFADGSGWEAVANILKKDGYTVSVVQHPETSFAEDVKFTKAVIDQQSGRQCENNRSEFESCGLHLSSEGNGQAHRRSCHLRAAAKVISVGWEPTLRLDGACLGGRPGTDIGNVSVSIVLIY